MSSNAQRFGEIVKGRRERLDLTQLDVWQHGGPSNTTLTKIENGDAETLPRSTARKLDAALLWEPGSARDAWDGGEPRPLEPPAVDELTALLTRLEELGAGQANLDAIRRDVEQDQAERRGAG
jgi:transcriptional regulator with XRE-family HTH domain